MNTVWIVVASNTRCRIFAQHQHNGPLEELEDLVHPEGRLHERKLASDRPGRTFDRAGEGRHAKGNPVKPQEQENIRFAKAVAEKIDHARKEDKFERLVLVADPGFLGQLRQELPPPTHQKVSAELQKNLVEAAPDRIREALPYRI